MLLTVILIIIISFITPSLFHSMLQTFLFCKSFPTQPSVSSSGLTAWIPRTFIVTSEHIRFYFFYITLFSCRFRVVD